MKRFAGKPFVLLGVNTDEDRQALKTAIEKEKITWRSWWDGGSMDGPIATKWQINNWPTIYVLDAKGVIRFVDESGGDVDAKPIDDVVESLLKELATKRP